MATNTPFPTAGELHLAIRENIQTLNPYLAQNVSEEFVVSLLYDTLLESDAHGDLRPNLAEHWELTPDGSRLSFTLNPQAKWHNGEAVTAADVVFSFRLVQQNGFPGFTRLAALVHRAEAISRTEVEFTLFTTWPDPVRLLGTSLPIVPATLWERLDDPLHYANLDNPVGSGPFLLVEHIPGERLILRNTGIHPSGQPSIGTLVLEIQHDESKALQALKDGKLDALGWEITPAQARDVRDHPEDYPGIRMAEAPGLSIVTLLFNLRIAPFDNPVLRRALAEALDTQAIIDQALMGFGDVAAGLFPPASPWHNTDIFPIAFDPQEAAAKLSAAGFIDRDGDGMRENPDGSALQIPITCPKQDIALEIGERIATNWKAIGIAAKAEPVDQALIMPILMQAQFHVILHRLSLQEPEMAFFYFHSTCGVLRDERVSGLNYGGYANPQYDEMVEALQQARDVEEKRELLCKLQAVLAADLPQIPLYVPRVLNLYREEHFTGWSAQPGIGLLNRITIANLRAQ
ncbi:MAG: ABC transporter substrate-binding protein [Chloroflexi bacterium]|nr:ABC transporter substrate-binding protein [Chloroflexota bacterium]